MNVDEAIAYASKDKCFWAGEVHTALETLAKEVERLRAEVEILAVEVTRLQAIEHERMETQTELAEAKAASVLPCAEESVIWLLAVAAKLEKDGESSGFDSMTKAAKWLRDRIKDTTPLAT